MRATPPPPAPISPHRTCRTRRSASRACCPRWSRTIPRPAACWPSCSSPTPAAALTRALAVAMVQGPEAGLAVVDELAADKYLANHHRLFATRAYLREIVGDREGAAADYRAAAELTDSAPEQRFLRAKSFS